MQEQENNHELDKLRDEFHQIANTHVTWTIFTWVIGIIITLNILAMGWLYNVRQKAYESNVIRITALEQDNTRKDVDIALIKQQYQQILDKINDLSVLLREHMKN